MLTEPSKAFGLVRKMLKFKPSLCDARVTVLFFFLISLPIVLQPQSDIQEAMFWILRTQS